MKIAFIGFGEAAQAFVQGWRTLGAHEISAYDILFDDPAAAAPKRAECAALGVSAAADAPAAVRGATLVICAVTAEQAAVAAGSALAGLGAGQLWCDINSAAPFRKAEAGDLVATTGAEYVDVAVMEPVHPKLHRVPLLLSGPGARTAEPLLTALGMQFEIVSDRTGEASTLKMIRSIAIKGIESVAMECVLAAVKLGIDEKILPSVSRTIFRHDGFESLADYVSERVAVHGKRRAAEMREVAATLAHLGLPNYMAAGSAAHQQWVSDSGVRAQFGANVPADARLIAHALLDLMESRGER